VSIPFKLPVSKLSEGMLESWHYQPTNLGPGDYDTMLFGEFTDASAVLSGMREKITTSGPAWMEYLTPAEALRQVRRHGEDAYCEKIWIADYEAFLNGRASRCV
jgi:hypothetical protein